MFRLKSNKVAIGFGQGRSFDIVVVRIGNKYTNEYDQLSEKKEERKKKSK